MKIERICTITIVVAFSRSCYSQFNIDRFGWIWCWLGSWFRGWIRRRLGSCRRWIDTNLNRSGRGWRWIDRTSSNPSVTIVWWIWAFGADTSGARFTDTFCIECGCSTLCKRNKRRVKQSVQYETFSDHDIYYLFIMHSNLQRTIEDWHSHPYHPAPSTPHQTRDISTIYHPPNFPSHSAKSYKRHFPRRTIDWANRGWHPLPWDIPLCSRRSLGSRGLLCIRCRRWRRDCLDRWIPPMFGRMLMDKLWIARWLRRLFLPLM